MSCATVTCRADLPYRVGVWNSIWSTVKEELSDVSDAAAFTRVCLRLLIAGLLGAALGYERESAGKSAGLRTHMLVCLGSALFLMTPQLAGAEESDLSRVVQGLVAGVGFLGAGAIIRNTKHKDESGTGDPSVKGSSDEVKGMTTAAGIWMTAAIGMAVGMGRELTAVLSTVLALIVLAVVPKVVGKVQRRRDDSVID